MISAVPDVANSGTHRFELVQVTSESISHRLGIYPPRESRPPHIHSRIPIPSSPQKKKKRKRPCPYLCGHDISENQGCVRALRFPGYVWYFLGYFSQRLEVHSGELLDRRHYINLSSVQASKAKNQGPGAGTVIAGPDHLGSLLPPQTSEVGRFRGKRRLRFQKWLALRLHSPTQLLCLAPPESRSSRSEEG